MEKLKMKALSLGIMETLTNEQMKNVKGGTGCHAGACTSHDQLHGGEYGEPGYCTGNGINAPCQCLTGSGYHSDPICFSN